MAFDHPALATWYDAVPLDSGRMEEVLHPEVEFNVCAGWPNGGSFQGHDGVLRDFFPQASKAWERLKPEVEEVIEVGDKSIVRGHYVGVAAGGEPFSLEFVHIWGIRDGKIASLHQVADSALLMDALAAGAGAVAAPEG